jgi:hypothetical protein
MPGATVGAGPVTHLVLLALVLCFCFCLLLALVARKLVRHSSKARPQEAQATRLATQELPEVVHALVLVVPPPYRAAPARRRQQGSLLEDDVIAFGQALEKSDDVVGDVLAETLDADALRPRIQGPDPR